MHGNQLSYLCIFKLPWKSLRDIVEYYYMWKTTDRYVQQKRVKAGEAESRLKQVYIPAYTKPNSNILHASSQAMALAKCCESCLCKAQIYFCCLCSTNM